MWKLASLSHLQWCQFSHLYVHNQMNPPVKKPFPIAVDDKLIDIDRHLPAAHSKGIHDCVRVLAPVDDDGRYVGSNERGDCRRGPRQVSHLKIHEGDPYDPSCCPHHPNNRNPLKKSFLPAANPSRSSACLFLIFFKMEADNLTRSRISSLQNPSK